MKKALNFILTSFYAFVLMILAVLVFWEYKGKEHVESYIRTEYGNAIIQQSEDLKIIKAFNIFKKDDSSTSN